MNKKQKKNIKRAAILLLLLLLSFGIFLFFFNNPFAVQQTIIVKDGVTTTTSSGGGSSGGSSPSPSVPSTDWSFFGLFDIPNPFVDFKLPSFSFPTGTPDATDAPLPFVPIDECSKDSQCNKCANPTYDKCSSGKCVCSAHTIFDSIRDVFTPTVRTTAECTTNSQCDIKCATSNSGVCSNGVCGCTNPTAQPTPSYSCVDTDVSSRSSDGLNYQYDGTCTITEDYSRSVLFFTDSCSATLLKEYYCRNSNTCAYKLINCETEYGRGYFCMDGFCTKVL